MTVGSGQAAVAARVPGAALLGLSPPGPAATVPAVRFADPAWTADLLARRAAVLGTTDPRILATVWWYSASSVLLTPALAGLVTGIPLSGRLEDLSVWFQPGPLPGGAVAAGPGAGDLAAQLGASLAAGVAAVATAAGVRERPLWAIVTGSLADRLLVVGRAVGQMHRATALAAPLAAAIGPPLPAPRYEDVGATRFVRRVSCCLLDRIPGGPTCLACPRRPPAERRTLLAARAPYGRGQPLTS